MINLHNTAKNIQKMEKFQGDIFFLESMKTHTTFQVGGDAQVFAIPHTQKSLLILLDEIIKNNLTYFILGGGSNIVVSDLGIDGFVISTEKLNSIELITDAKGAMRIRCEAGCTIEQVIQFCVEHELTGLETFAGLPGSVGGAVFMNARCYDISVCDVLEQAQFIELDDVQKTQIYKMDVSDWDYKKSPFQKNKCILSADFCVHKGTKTQIDEKCKHYINDRESKGHFSHPCAGSVFKNNRNFGSPSGQIIDSVGLKGFTKGNAQIAPWHGNIIINLGGASADDIKEIVKHVQEAVWQKTGYNLECEILFIGNFPDFQ